MSILTAISATAVVLTHTRFHGQPRGGSPAIARPASPSRRGGVSGQTMVEYVIVVCLLMISALFMISFKGFFVEYGARVIELASSEYP